MRCTRLPGPALRRRVILAARHRELGRLPQSLASFSTQLLQESVLPEIARMMPFAVSEIEIG
jgi:hypothetical protein